MVASVDAMGDANTAQLVQDAQLGSIEAFAMLVERYEREIHRYLLGMLENNEDACDYVQQVFLKAWLNLTTLQNAACFKVWLYAIARNLVRDHWRSKKLSCLSWEELVGDTVELANKEFELLELFVQNAGVLLTYDYLLTRVWGDEAESERRYIHVYVNRLRKKIEIPAGCRFIHNEPKIGYRFQLSE